MDKDNVVQFPAQQMGVMVKFGTDRAVELAQFFQQPASEVMEAYLHQWEEGPCEPQELADRMAGAIIAAEANLRAALHMVAGAMGFNPIELTNMTLSNLATTMANDLSAEAERVQ